METKFTPGPWVVYPETDGTEIYAVDYTPGLPIRQFIARPDRGANWISNAHLIAAAPELFDCLQRCLDEMAWIGPKAKKTAEDSRAALAKARGE